MKENIKEIVKENMQDKLKKLTEELERTVQQFMSGEKYMAFLSSMAKFHKFSLNNQILIAMQKKDATLCASYGAWKKNFGRYVKKGEEGIRIICPAPFKKKISRKVIDEETREKEKKVMEVLENYVENHPQVTAFFTVDLQTGVLVYRVLQKKNLRKEIVFFDGVEEGYEFHTYCTHVMQGQYLMGAMAVKNLCRLIKGGEVELRKYVPYSIIKKDPQM